MVLRVTSRAPANQIESSRMALERVDQLIAAAGADPIDATAAGERRRES